MNLCGYKILLCLLVGYNLCFIVNSCPPPEPGQEIAAPPPPRLVERIGNWLKNVGNKIKGIFRRGSTTPIPPLEVIETEQNPLTKFCADLSKTTFDPNRDWIYRIGNWYIIKKVDGLPPPPGWNPDSRMTEEYLPTSTSTPQSNTEDIETLGPNHKQSTTPNVFVQPDVTTEVVINPSSGADNDVSNSGTTVNTVFTTEYINDLTTVIATTRKDIENEVVNRVPNSAEVITP